MDKGRGAPAKCALIALLSIGAATVSAPASASPAAGPAATKGSAQPGSLRSLKALEALEPRALRLFPESFGGLWLEGRKVFIAFTERDKKRAKRVGSRFPDPKRLRGVIVDDSLAALRRLQGQMIADRRANPVTATDPGSRRPVPLAYDLNIDIKRNVVEAIIQQAVTPDVVAAFTGRYGDDVVVKQGPPVEPVCNTRLDCAPALRSGIETQVQSGGYCSTAFNVIYPSFENIAGILSAAHCGTPDTDYLDDRGHAGLTYGEVVAEQESGPVDAELHSVLQNGFFSIFPLIYVTDSQQAGHVGKVGTYDGLPVGLGVCKAGVATGKTCGKVLSKTYSFDGYVSNAYDFIATDACVDNGDSGSGFYHLYLKPKKFRSGVIRYEALGVTSGTAYGLPCSSPSYYSIFGHIEYIQKAFALTVLKDPN